VRFEILFDNIPIVRSVVSKIENFRIFPAGKRQGDENGQEGKSKSQKL